MITIRLFLLFGFFLGLFSCGVNGGTVAKELIVANSNKTMILLQHKQINESYFDNITKKFYIDSGTWTIKPLQNTESKVVLITIDDAPDQYALEMGQLLKSLNVPAIFFVNGHFIDSEEEQEVVRELDRMGFAIGNHTNTHVNLSNISSKKQREEILSVNTKIRDIIGKEVYFFRAPFGINTDISTEIIRKENMLAMNWTYGYDWEVEYQNKEKLADIMVNTPLLHEGAILLLHDRKWTYEALGDIVKGLKDKGYQFVDPKQIKGHP